MCVALSPLVSEFETQSQADSHQKWLEAKTQASVDDSRPRVPHNQVMAKARAIIESKKPKHVGN